MNYTRHFIAGEVQFAERKSLIANTALTYYVNQCNSIDIQNLSSTDEVYLSVDGKTPTVDGPNTLLIPAGTGLSIPFRPEIKVISAGAPKLQFVGVN